MDCSYCLLKKENSKKLSAVIGDNETAAEDFFNHRLHHDSPACTCPFKSFTYESNYYYFYSKLQQETSSPNAVQTSGAELCMVLHPPSNPGTLLPPSRENGRPCQPSSSAPFTPAPRGDIPSSDSIGLELPGRQQSNSSLWEKGSFPFREIEEQLVMAGVRQMWIK